MQAQILYGQVIDNTLIEIDSLGQPINKQNRKETEVNSILVLSLSKKNLSFVIFLRKVGATRTSDSTSNSTQRDTDNKYIYK